jgi:hypothetical protein
MAARGWVWPPPPVGTGGSAGGRPDPLLRTGSPAAAGQMLQTKAKKCELNVVFVLLLKVILVAEFIDHDWADNVNSGIGLSYRPARLHGLAGQYDNPMPELTLSQNHRSMNAATVL